MTKPSIKLLALLLMAGTAFGLSGCHAASAVRTAIQAVEPSHHYSYAVEREYVRTHNCQELHHYEPQTRLADDGKVELGPAMDYYKCENLDQTIFIATYPETLHEPK